MKIRFTPVNIFLTLNSCGVLFFGQVPVSNISFRIQLLVRDFSQVFKNFLTQLKKCNTGARFKHKILNLFFQLSLMIRSFIKVFLLSNQNMNFSCRVTNKIDFFWELNCLI